MLLNLSVAGLFAQSSLIATLSHGDSISMYYGNNALNDALNTAVSGDVISLSGGSFAGPQKITKAVSIRGAGIDESLPTYITGRCNIVVEDENGKLSFEGINFTNDVIIAEGGTECSANFTKCKIAEVAYVRTSIYVNFINCVIEDFQTQNTPSGNIQCLNSNIKSFRTYENHGAASFVNCILRLNNYDGIHGAQAINSIFFYIGNDKYYNYELSPTSIANNCVAINIPNFFKQQQASIGNETSSSDVFFKNLNTFELTDEAKAKFLGTDSTEVGWYGGAFPYTSIPSYPRITKMNVANKSTVDGKLSVEIEVSAAK